MKLLLAMWSLSMVATLSWADDAEAPPVATSSGPTSPGPTPLPTSPSPLSPGPTPPVRTSPSSMSAGSNLIRAEAQPDAAAAPASSSAGEPARFETASKWDLAGYNLDEVIYTVLVTSHDARIIRCTTEIAGSYFENGQKLSIADRQITTVFPEQQAQVGNWMGMDQKSGATFSVKCRAV